MKKVIVLSIVALVAVSAVFATGSKEALPDTEKGEGVMTYAEYDAAELDSEVVIEAYVQGHQSWWNNSVTIYLQDADGGYFAYNCACDEATAEKLVKGTKVKISGYKGAWAGEVEIMDGTLEIEEGSWVAKATDVTEKLDSLESYRNQYVVFKNAKVTKAPLYSWDGSGSREANSDIYVGVEVGSNAYTFTVESYLCGNDTQVYSDVEALKEGDTVDFEGFLYWYNAPQLHVTGVTVK